MDKPLVGQILAIKIHVCKPKVKMVLGSLQLCVHRWVKVK